jgi:intein/homing endonuclease
VDQCFVPETLVLVEGIGLTPISGVKAGDKVLTSDGHEKIMNVKEFDANDRDVHVITTDNSSVSVTGEHPFLCVKTDDTDIALIRTKLKAGTLHLEWVEAKDLTEEYMVVG